MSDKPSAGDIAYVIARNRQQAFNVLVEAVKESALSQSQIAEYVGITEERLSDILTYPRQVEFDTLSKVIFVACGAAVRMTLTYPITPDMG
jgi:predicted XRE-type DNA-binding protein